MKILLLCDDYWHPGDVPTNGVKPLESQGYTFDIISDGGDFCPSMLKNYPVVMLCKCNQKSQADDSAWMTAEVQQAFVDFVENGGGLLVVHSGTVPSETTEMMSRLIGCRFTFHPNRCPVTVAPILPHPVTDGVGMFCEVDEHYRLEILSDDVKAIIASYSAEQGEKDKYEEDPYHNATAWISAAGLVRTQGKGRVCVLTPGHIIEVWQNTQFQKTLANAIDWCGEVHI